MLGLVTLGALLFAGTGAGLAYADIQGNISSRDISDLLGRGEDDTPVDPSPGEPLDFLVLGSDAREGDSDIDGAGAVGEVTGMRADTTMIVHIAADRSRAVIVSIPRDTLVQIPSCTMPDGTKTEAHEGIFNSAFTIGGETGDVGSAAACTIRTVEHLTGLTIDDFVVVDFAGFINVIDALDGIAVHVPEAVDDPLYTGLELDEGCHVMDGKTALAYSRVRHGVGDGGDISRISRQQTVVDAVVEEALNRNLLTDLPSLYAFLDAGTQTLTTGTDLSSLTTLGGLANSLRGIDSSDITFTTMPFAPKGPRVVPVPETRDLWLRLQADLPAPVEAPVTGDQSTAAPEEDAADSQDTSAASSHAASPSADLDAAATPEETATPVCTK